MLLEYIKETISTAVDHILVPLIFMYAKWEDSDTND